MYITTCLVLEQIECQSIWNSERNNDHVTALIWHPIGEIVLRHPQPLVQSEVEAIERRIRLKYSNPIKVEIETIREIARITKSYQLKTK